MVLPAFAALILGCAAKNSTPVHQATESAVIVGAAGGSIKARAGFIEDQADAVLKVTVGTPEAPIVIVKPQVESIKAEAVNIVADQLGADIANAAEREAYQAELNRLGNQNIQLQLEYARLESRWYVGLGRWIQRMVVLLVSGIVFAWIAGNVLNVFLPKWLPVHGLGIAKWLVRISPLPIFTSPLRDRLLKK